MPILLGGLIPKIRSIWIIKLLSPNQKSLLFKSYLKYLKFSFQLENVMICYIINFKSDNSTKKDQKIKIFVFEKS